MDHARHGRRILVVVAHPDDEVIGVGGQLARWSREAVLVHVTDGSPVNQADARAAGFASQQAYADARGRELDAALACLPYPPLAVRRLGATDQGVTHELHGTIHRLAATIRGVAPEVVITHAYEGGHPDHDAVAFAVAAVRRSGCTFQHLEFAGYHADDDGRLITNRFASPWPRATSVELDAGERLLKRRMLAAFRTQQRTLWAFRADREWLRPAPDYDFTAPPDAGRVWYEQFGWGLTAAEWRRVVAQVAHGLREEPLPC